MAPAIPNVKLNNGNEMPIFGLGTWKSKPGEVEEAVKNAIDVGYRHIDGAMVYKNEKEVGDAIKTKIDEGVVKREDLFVVSKLWNTFHRPDLVVGACKKTLADLQLNYIDMYLIHWPTGFLEDQTTAADPLFPKDDQGRNAHSEVDYVDTYLALEECVRLGLTKSIGLSNFNKAQIERVLEKATIAPANLQVEIHPYLNQEKLVNFCKGKNIAVTGYSPLGSADRPWAKPEDPKLLDDAQLIELGKKYNKSAAQVVLRWLTQRGVIAIPKSVHKNRLIENMDIFDFTLSDEDMAYVNTFERNGRTCHAVWDNHHKYHPFNDEYWASLVCVKCQPNTDYC